MNVITTPGEQQKKEQLTLSVKSKLKQQVKQEIEYSSMTFSALMEEAMEEFLEDDVSSNPDVKYEEMEEYVCSNCSAIATEAVLKKTDGDCPSCEESIEK